jgi:hypothetical protein
MGGRVIPYAERIGAEYYNPSEDISSMENNREWIKAQMEDGCLIIDCGPAPGRALYPNPTSEYYQMELDEIGKAEYPNYIRVHIDEP